MIEARTTRAGSAPPGQALIEFALILPLLFLLIVNVLNFGAFLAAWIAVANGARTGAHYMAMGGASVRAPVAPSNAAVVSLVTNDLHMLPNSTSLQVSVCKSNVNGCGAFAPTDPEGATNYVLGAVDVTYTYRPLIPLWDFPGMNLHATLPPRRIHRRATMRMLQ